MKALPWIAGLGGAALLAAAALMQLNGDPAKAAAAILALLNSGRPLPGRLALGADAVSLIKNKLKVMEKSLMEWESLSMASGGSEGTMSLHSSAVSQSGN